MPTNLNLKVGMGFEGKAIGTPTTVDLNTLLGREAVLTSVTGAGKQVFERWAVPLTLTTTATTILNLISGMVNPLGESISGTVAFSRVIALLVQHDGASPSANVIQVFGGTVGSLFQGPLSTTASIALPPGHGFGFNVPYTTVTGTTVTVGWTVNSTAKNIEIRNLGTTVATVNIVILGVV